jgi:hypothetical protein
MSERFMYVARTACGKVSAGCWLNPADPTAAEKFAAEKRANGCTVEKVSECPPMEEWMCHTCVTGNSKCSPETRSIELALGKLAKASLSYPAAADRDAARYRWLRTVIIPGEKTPEWHRLISFTDHFPETPEGFDAAVDAARQGDGFTGASRA